ncbi:MAG: aldolase/citrate lyase family protein [Chloroflexota bacterium]|nr:aldolase/citrate lyase family protein [Chloroflexota bacterium]MDE2969907.1 aldolase/citrate lyase family protein [Chloroflexota bacterium]
MALADYLLPHEYVAAESGRVAVTNLRLIHHVPRGGAPLFREFSYGSMTGVRLSQRPRVTTVVLGALIAALSLLAEPGTTLQLVAAGLGAVAVLLGIIFGDLALVVSTVSDGGKPRRLPLRETSRREGEELTAIALAAMNGEYDFIPEPPPPPLAPPATARSVLLLPADDAARILETLGGDADALCLDLTTLVHPSRRNAARELARSAIAAAARAGLPMWVRMGLNEAEADMAACVRPGLSAVVAAAESPEDVQRLDALLGEMEGERGLRKRVRVVVQVETAAGVLALRDMLSTTPRVSAAIAATHDALDLLGRPDIRSVWAALRPPVLPETAHLRGRISAAATEAGVPVYACLATDIASDGLTEALGHDAAAWLAEGAAAARAHGCRGVVTLHPEAAEACNAIFPGSAMAVTPAAPAPSPWQPVVPSHFGIGVTRAEAAAAPVAKTNATADSNPTPSTAAPAPTVWQPVVPSHFGIGVPPRATGELDGASVDATSGAETPARGES